MKKRVLVFCLILLFLVYLANALEIQSDKNIYDQGETAIFRLQGNILEPINKENIGFFVGFTQKPFRYDILRIGEIYYIYTITPYIQEDYVMKIENVNFKENNQFKEETLEFLFSTTNKTADFYVFPGAIITSKDFVVEAYNNLNVPIEIKYSLENVSRIKILPSQETTSFAVPISQIPATMITSLIVNSQTVSYTIPNYIITNKTLGTNDGTNGEGEGIDLDDFEIPVGKPFLLFSIDSLNEELKKGETYVYPPIFLKNFGDKDSGEISLFVSKDLKNILTLSETKLSSLAPNEEKPFDFEISSSKSGNFSGYIEAKYSGESVKLNVTLFFGENITAQISLINQSQRKSCGELNGKICLASESCKGKIDFASDGACCLGVCNPLSQDSSGSSSNTTWAIVIVGILLLIILVFVRLRMKKSEDLKSSKDLLKEKEKSFSERFETKGSLTNV